MIRQKYWFKVWFGKWEEENFDPEDSFVYVEAWDAKHAYTKASHYYEIEEGEVIIGVQYMGYPQNKVTEYEETLDEKD